MTAKRKIILFNGRWQAYENTQVMVSNRNGKDAQIFCPASEVQIGDNVWEHNIVSTILYIDTPAVGIKFHYGPTI